MTAALTLAGACAATAIAAAALGDALIGLWRMRARRAKELPRG